MKKLVVLIILLPVFALVSCTKEEPAMKSPQSELQLKAQKCTPSVMNYDETFIVNQPFIPTGCFLEPIFVTSWITNNKGRVVVAASCRFNDKGTQTMSITGFGMFFNDPYQAEYTQDYHFLGSLTGQGAQVTRFVQDAVFTNMNTGVTFMQSFNMFQTVNANGEITVDSVEFIPCY
jgi:hypothetical protein